MKFDELVIATHNKGKVSEISDLLEGLADKCVSAGELGLPEPVEDGDTFAANALIKARSAYRHCGKASLADDSGLVVNALGGDPGIYSSRLAGPDKDFNLAMTKINEALSKIGGASKDRSAAFICALALVTADGQEHAFEGRVDGVITWPMRGDKGFGYDPIFVPNGHTITFAEMEPADKHAISHRAKAFEKMKKALL